MLELRGRAPDLALFAGVFLIRLLLALEREVFTVSADEPANLAMARTLSGRGSWNMFGFATWQPGFAILLAPFHWLTTEPSVFLRLALTLNCAIAALSALVLVRVLMRVTATSGNTGRAVAFAVAVAPTSIAASSYVWAEPLVTLLFLVTLLAVMRLYRAGRFADGVVAILASAAGSLAHGRLAPLFAVASCLALAHSIVRERWKTTIGYGAIAAVSTIGTVAISTAVEKRVWERPATINNVRSVLERLDDPAGIAVASIGQIWYQLVATVGIVGVGLWITVRAAAGRWEGFARRDGRILLALVTPQLCLSALFMSSRPRIDHAIYGRYNDAILWPIVGIGVAWLVSRDSSQRSRSLGLAAPASIVAAIAVSGTTVRLIHHDLLASGTLSRDMVPGVMAFEARAPALAIIPTSIAAAVIAAALLSLRRLVPGSSLWIVVPVIALLIAGGLRTRAALSLSANQWTDARAVTELNDEILAPGTEVGYYFDPNSAAAPFSTQLLYANLYQWFLPQNEFSWDWGPDDEVGPLVFAPVDSSAMVAADARILWRDPNVSIALWREPTPD